MKKILIPTDGSTNAAHALKYAINLFIDQRVEFILFQSLEVPVYTTEVPYPMDLINVDEPKRILDEMAATLRTESTSSDHSFSTVVQIGSLTFNIEEMVERSEIDMVVMGTKGASGLAATIIGTNTEDVIQTVSCPVLAIPERAEIDIPRQILFASDNRGLSNGNVVHQMIELAERFKAHIHLLNVLDEGKMSTVDEAVAGLKLDHLLGGVDHTFHFENGNDKALTIEIYLNTHNIDMLAMVPRKNSFFQSIFHRSVTRKLALHSTVPLLAMHDNGN